MAPDVDEMICKPTDNDKIRNTGMEGIHWSPNKMMVISPAENQSNIDNGKPMKA